MELHYSSTCKTPKKQDDAICFVPQRQNIGAFGPQFGAHTGLVCKGLTRLEFSKVIFSPDQPLCIYVLSMIICG